MSQPVNLDGRAQKDQQTFRLQYSVGIHINAAPDKIWALLTSAADIPRWTSTVTSIDGTIAPGQKIKLRVPIAPQRTFQLKVSVFEPGKSLVLRDGMAPMFQGVRTYSLAPRPDGTTEFAMTEVLSGLMLPMIRGALPDFTASFEQYAKDLKKEAERT